MDGPLAQLLSGRVSPNRAALKPYDLTPAPAPNMFSIPPPPDPLDVPFGQAVSEGAGAHLQDFGASPETARKLGDVFSNAVQMYPPVAMTSAAHDVATSDDPEAMMTAVQTGLNTVNPLARAEKLISAVDEASTPTPLSETLSTATKPSITAYHGSPHDFAPEEGAPYGRFRDDKAFTGEGAQMYGSGHYLAENEDVGRRYRDALAQDYYQTADGKLWSPDALEHLNVRSLLSRTGDIDAALKKANELLPTANAQTMPMLQGDIARLEDLKARGGIHKGSPGHMYETRINADPEHFLNFDAPLEGQPAFEMLKSHWDQSVGDPGIILQRLGLEPATSLGADLHGQLGGVALDADVKVKETLMKAGVPGIKYLDQNSRKAGEGSRNYVVFDPKIIDIVRKYGIAGALGAGLITQEMADQMQAQQGEGGT